MVPTGLVSNGGTQSQEQLQIQHMAEEINELRGLLRATEDRLEHREGLLNEFEAECRLATSNNERLLHEKNQTIEKLKESYQRISMGNLQAEMLEEQVRVIEELKERQERLKSELYEGAKQRRALQDQLQQCNAHAEMLEQQVDDLKEQRQVCSDLQDIIDEKQKVIEDFEDELEKLRHKYNNSLQSNEHLITKIAQLKRTIGKNERSGKKVTRKITRASVESDLKVELHQRMARLERVKMDVDAEANDHAKAGRKYEAFFKRFEHELMCPISYGMFEDPVIAADGHTYDRSSMDEWLEKCPSFVVNSPMTGQPLEHERLVSNHAMKKMSDLYSEMQKLSTCSS